MLTVIDKAKMFREIVNEMADLYEKKNANYGDSFGQLFDALGPISGLVPLHNKLDRATSLIKGNQNNFESLEDTFKDLACYAIMNLIEMKVKNQKITNVGTLTTTPGIFELNPGTITTVKDPCVGCPWNQNILFGTTTPYIGDTPCQWCEHGPKLTCKSNTTYCTSTIDNMDLVTTDTDYLKKAIEPTQTTTAEVVTEQPKEKPVQVFKPIKKKK